MSPHAIHEPPPLVELRGIGKRYPGVVANRDVNLAVHPGQIHAVVGENGAGKSTLMRILYGEEQPDEGELLLDGETVRLRSPADAIAAGIGMVHQHFMLAENLTVLENVILGAENTRWGLLDRRSGRRAVREVSERYGLDVDPDATVEHLGVGQRQRVEILKVLYRGARVLIFDEPTAVLVPGEVRALFGSLAGLRAQGLAVVFISHKLDEVLAVSDHITVIRAGTSVGSFATAEADPRRLSRLIVGGELPAPAARRRGGGGEVVLRLRGLRADAVADATLEVAQGEILGIAGVQGNGQTELIEAIMGIRAVSGGSLHIAGREATHLGTRGRRRLGLACIPEDRHRQALALPATLWENAMLGSEDLRRRSRWRVDRKAARDATGRLVAGFGIRSPSVDVPAAALSGGNQQKLVVGRELGGRPKVLLAAHPTRGVDVGAQAVIWERLRDARDDGLAVLLVGADLDELLGLSDRVQVMLRGRLSPAVPVGELTVERLGRMMTGAEPEPVDSAAENR
ncbi:ABC transporter ATP-binding protein [Microbispora sp. H10885]|uniref:ABC transporter ATP-binding protein n=1 Tax=Microbispora sp. H10885 TaxID=2729110 RepID=UPI001601782B|nr:ABC transporter ATP-binding protein [Microbispora sp. H10885]